MRQSYLKNAALMTGRMSCSGWQAWGCAFIWQCPGR